MKRLAAILTCASVILCAIPLPAASAEQGISVYSLGEKLSLSANPQIVQGSAMLPVRSLCEALGLKASYDASSKAVAVDQNGVAFRLAAGMSEAFHGDEKLDLSASAAAIEEDLLAPLDFFSAVTGKDFLWDGETQTVYIENRNPNAYESVEKPFGGLAAGIGNTLVYQDTGRLLAADLYATTFDGKTSTRLLDGSAIAKPEAGVKAPGFYSISPYSGGKAVVSAERGGLYLIDPMSSSAQTFSAKEGLSGAPAFQKQDGAYLYFTETVFAAGGAPLRFVYRKNIETGKNELLLDNQKELFPYQPVLRDLAVSGNTAFLLHSSINFSDLTLSTIETDYLVFHFDTGKLELLATDREYGQVQAVNDTFYMTRNRRLYRYDFKKAEFIPVSPEDIKIKSFAIQNGTVFYEVQTNGAGAGKAVLYRSPLNFSYRAKLISGLRSAWSIVGSHIVYQPAGRNETFLANTDGSGSVMLRGVKEYVGLDGKPVGDIP